MYGSSLFKPELIGIRSQQDLMQPATVQFVTGHYKTKRERQDARTRIRTHAANVSRWRQWTRLVDTHAAQNLAQQPPVFASAEPQKLSISNSAARETGTLFIEDAGLADAREEHENWTQHLVFTLSIEQFFDTLNISLRLPVEQLSVLPREVTLNALQQVYCVVDQTFLPSKQSGLNQPAVFLMQQIVSDIGLLHSWLFSQLVRNKATHRQVTNGTDYHLLACSAQAVQNINFRLGDAQTGWDDSTILAVASLAYSGKVNVTKDLGTVPTPTQGPLRALQMLDLYGNMIETEDAHEQGLARMIQLRGGINQIKLPGLAMILSYADIIHSSRRLTTPCLPFQPAFNDDHDTLLKSLRRRNRRLHSIGNGFSVLGIALPNTDLQALHATLQRLSLYTLAIEDYITGSSFAQRLVVLADQRNFCQHSLLSLIPNPDNDAENDLIRVCRIAAMTYSFLCVFPISATSFAKLAAAIKTILSRRNFEEIRREVPRLVVWIVMMGAIAAIGSEHRTWFIAALDRCLSRLKIDSWDALKELLEEFLWLHSTNDADGYDLWVEVEESSPFKMGESTPEEVGRLPPVNRAMSHP